MRIPYTKSTDIDLSSVREEGDMIIVEGIAGDTSRDIVGDMASKTFLQRLNDTLPGRPVFYNHNYKAPQLGKVLETQLIDDGNRLWAKCAIYKTKTNENIIKGLLDGSLGYYSIGAVGRQVHQAVMQGMPTRIFNDGYAQELTITGVPINPTAAFKVAKSEGSDLDPDVYNNKENIEIFIKAVQDQHGVDIFEERNRIATEMEEFFMKGQEGALMQNYWNDKGKTNGRYDTLNPPAEQSGPALSDLRPEGGQLTPMPIATLD